MGSGSAIRQHERRFSQREPAWSGEKEECIFDEMPELVKVFGGYEMYKSKDGGYELAKGDLAVGTFSDVSIEKDRVVFPLSHGMLLEVSERGRREILSPAKALLCGLIASDGGNHFYWYFDQSRGRYYGQYKTYLNSKDKEPIGLFDSLSKEVYNKTSHHYFEADGMIRAMINDKGIFYDLNDIGIKTGPYRFHVPIEHLDEDGLRAYLKGFFSGDGNVSKTGETYMIRVYSKYRDCLEELRQAFMDLGFHPHEIQEKERQRVRRGRIEKWTDRWFTLPEEDHLKFIEEIGTVRLEHLTIFEAIKKKKELSL